MVQMLGIVQERLFLCLPMATWLLWALPLMMKVDTTRDMFKFLVQIRGYRTSNADIVNAPKSKQYMVVCVQSTGGNEAWCGGYANDGEAGKTPNKNCCICMNGK